MTNLFDFTMHKGAEFSGDRAYRYALWRTWEPGASCMFIGLNPSTADENTDDPTIRRCIGFARLWGYGSLYMLNLFGFRATDPREMKDAANPIGGSNDETLTYYRSRCSLIIAAWGKHGTHLNRAEHVMQIMARRIDCLGRNQDGTPKHPLYLKANTKPELFYSPAE